MGANVPADFMQQCLTHPQIKMMTLLYAAPKQYKAEASVPKMLKKHARVLFLISTFAGNFVKIKHLNKIKNLDSFYDIKIRLKDKIFVTTDYDTSPGLIYLCHESQEVLERDYMTVRELEKNMYEVL